MSGGEGWIGAVLTPCESNTLCEMNINVGSKNSLSNDNSEIDRREPLDGGARGGASGTEVPTLDGGARGLNAEC